MWIFFFKMPFTFFCYFAYIINTNMSSQNAPYLKTIKTFLPFSNTKHSRYQRPNTKHSRYQRCLLHVNRLSPLYLYIFFNKHVFKSSQVHLPALVGRRCGHRLVGTSGLEWAHWEHQTAHFCVTLQSPPFWGVTHATTAGGGQTSNWIKVSIVNLE